VTVKSPIFDSFGQPAPGGEVGVSAAYWAALQTSRPEPTEGLTETPSGRRRTVFRTGLGTRRSGSMIPESSTPMS
jgi:hypothetical protein